MSENVVTVGVSAKFYCSNKLPMGNAADGEETFNVEFFPVMPDGSEENDKFWEATPAGMLSLYGIRKNAADHFELGKEYYLTMLPAEVITAGFEETASATANYMSRNIMTSEDGKTFYGRYDQFSDPTDFVNEVLNQGIAEAVIDPEEVFMRPATPEELKELDVDEWFYETKAGDLAENATRYYKAEAYDPGAE